MPPRSGLPMLAPSSSSSRRTPTTKRRALNRMRPNSTTDPRALDCPICFETFTMPVTTTCGHSFCFLCLFRDTSGSCPLCRSHVSILGGDFEPDQFLELSLQVYTEEADRHQKLKRTFDAVAPLFRTTNYNNLADAAPRQQQSRGAIRPSAEALRSLYNVLRGFVTHLKSALSASSVNKDGDERGWNAELACRQEWLSLSAFTRCGQQSEQCEMYFCGGFMRRRAPSLLLLVDDASTNQGRRSEVKDQRHLPVLLQPPPHAELVVHRRLDPIETAASMIAEDTSAADDEVIEQLLSEGRYKPTHRLQASRANLLSADSRLQADLRLTIKSMAHAHVQNKKPSKKP